ncbi:hypothetical protein [Streptomyces sp. NPDC088348]|uniref:hypothetical protein n=1 Tax=Streptomyces sp. NPDC088348 TaxID=3365853 RepID=UPI00382E0D4C
MAEDRFPAPLYVYVDLLDCPSVADEGEYFDPAAVLSYAAENEAPEGEADFVRLSPPFAPKLLLVVPAEAPAPSVAEAVSKFAVYVFERSRPSASVALETRAELLSVRS